MQPILAAEFGKILSVAFVIIWFITWVIKQAKAAQAANPAPRPRPANDPLQNEIEVFLRETDARRDDEPILEVVPDDEVRPRPQRPQRPQRPRREGQRARGATPPRPPAAKRERPRLGSGVQPHIGEAMGARHIQPHVAQSTLASAVAQSVQQHFGASSSEHFGRQPTDHPLVRLLRQPGGAQSAIVLSEILKPRRRG